MRSWAAWLALLAAFSAGAHNGKGGTSFPPVPSIAGLHVVGNKIENGSGQVVQLRGVDNDGLEYMCIDGTVGDIFDPTMGSVNAQTAPGTTTINSMKSWGIDVVRLPLNESCWLGINGATTGGTTYQTAVEGYVSALTAANIAVILDLQWVGPGTQLAQDWCGGQFAPLPDADHASAFWTSVATAFKSNSSVIFDLYNEPWPENNADTTAAWTALAKGQTTGGATYQVNSTNSSCATAYNAIGTQALVTAIRGTGATNIIEVPGIQFTNTMDSWLANEPTDTLTPAQISAGWHSYAGQSCSNVTCFNSVIAPIAASVPVTAEEIGENDCQSVYIDPLMQWLDAYGVNYLEWSWNTYNCTSFPGMVTDATNGVPVYTFGSDFQEHLLALTGRSAPAQPTLPKFSTVFPVGLAIGASTQYTAMDGTVYYPDVTGTGLTVCVANGSPCGSFAFTPFTTTDTITGTSDPTLYKTGRQGCCATWIMNVPNGHYYVTFGLAPNSTYTAGTRGANISIPQNNQVAACVWSSDPSPTGCGNQNTNPAVDAASLFTYTTSIFVGNQQLSMEVAAATTSTILNTIKVCTSLPC